MNREQFNEVYRHSLAHILAKAVMEIFGRENVQIAIGPQIADGMYYDFLLPRGISTEDFPAIEAKMKEIMKRREPWTRKEVSKAEADAKTAEAQLAIAKKALESCVIKAPYDGVVAETYPESLDMVSVGQKILTLQSTDKVKFDVSIPETMVIDRRLGEEIKVRRHFVVFDSLPQREFDVAFEGFTSKADDRTQTFTATFSMPTQKEFVILPGMSVTLVITGGEKKTEDKGLVLPFAVPTVAVGADETGAHFVWKLVKSDKEGEYKTVKQRIETGRLVGTDIAVKSGLASGDRIAVAGVTILTEGQTVTLYGE